MCIVTLVAKFDAGASLGITCNEGVTSLNPTKYTFLAVRWYLTWCSGQGYLRVHTVFMNAFGNSRSDLLAVRTAFVGYEDLVARQSASLYSIRGIASILG